MLSHFTCSRGEPQAAFPPSPCAKSDNMSSNKKSPPQGSAESKLYRARLRAQYTFVVAVDICPCPSNTNISRLVAVVKRVSIFVGQNIAFCAAFGATAPPHPKGKSGAAVAPSHSQQRAARNSHDRAHGIPRLRRVLLATRREPVLWRRAPHNSMAGRASCVLVIMSRASGCILRPYTQNLRRQA